MNDRPYGQPVQTHLLADLPRVPVSLLRELLIVSSTVGHTEIHLSNGDVVLFHFHIDALNYDPATHSMKPSYRVVPELRSRSAEPLPRGMVLS